MYLTLFPPVYELVFDLGDFMNQSKRKLRKEGWPGLNEL